MSVARRNGEVAWRKTTRLGLVALLFAKSLQNVKQGRLGRGRVTAQFFPVSETTSHPRDSVSSAIARSSVETTTRSIEGVARAAFESCARGGGAPRLV